MIQFYSPDIKTTHALGPEESAHCVRVLRKRENDIIRVTDGKGNIYECRLVKADVRSSLVEIISEQEVSKNWAGEITLAVAPTKNADRMSWLVEKATEIGVDRIYLFNCRYSERKAVNIERLRRNAISAMNQSLKAYVPDIKGMLNLKEISGLKGEKFFGFCDSNCERKDFVKAYKPGSDTVIAIGPEGDFTREEVETLKADGYLPVTFGNNRLRTETAALYGLTAIHVINDYCKI